MDRPVPSRGQAAEPAGAPDGIALVGMMGSGKSTIGRALASRLGLAFADTDERIVQAEGRPIHEIFEQDGEAHFRDLEAAAVRECAGKGCVVATGGGAVLREENRELLWRRCWVVWLQADAEEHARRVSSGERRPVLERYPDPVEGARRVLAERRHLYALAHHVEDTTGRTVDEVVDSIVAAWNRRAGA